MHARTGEVGTTYSTCEYNKPARRNIFQSKNYKWIFVYITNAKIIMSRLWKMKKKTTIKWNSFGVVRAFAEISFDSIVRRSRWLWCPDMMICLKLFYFSFDRLTDTHTHARTNNAQGSTKIAHFTLFVFRNFIFVKIGCHQLTGVRAVPWFMVELLKIQRWSGCPAAAASKQILCYGHTARSRIATCICHRKA